MKARCQLAPPVRNKGHKSAVIGSAFRKPTHYETISKRIVTLTAKINISQELEEVDWQKVILADDVNEKADIFHRTVTEIHNKHCPIRQRRKQIDKPFIETRLTLKLRRAKLRPHRKNKIAWKFLNKIINKQLKKLRRKHA